MKSSPTKTRPRPVLHLLAAALVAALASVPAMALEAKADAHEDRAELRITELHKTLKIEPAQETQWLAVAKVMRDNAIMIDHLALGRNERAADLTALDDLKTYGEISEAHAAGVKNLTVAFTPLYEGMSAVQKKRADEFFRKGMGMRHSRKHHAEQHEVLPK